MKTYNELMDEVESKGGYDEQNEYITHCQEIVNVEEFNTNLFNFNIQDEELIELIFQATGIMSYTFSECDSYNFDTISYAFIMLAEENDDECRELMTEIIDGHLSADKVRRIFSLVEKNNDLEAQFNDGRVI